MQRHFAHNVRCNGHNVIFCNVYLIMKALNSFLMSQRQMTLKDIWVYNIIKLHRPSDAFLADTVDTI